MDTRVGKTGAGFDCYLECPWRGSRQIEYAVITRSGTQAAERTHPAAERRVECREATLPRLQDTFRASLYARFATRAGFRNPVFVRPRGAYRCGIRHAFT